MAAGRELVEAEPLTTAQLAKALAERWPDRVPNSLAYASRFLLPIVQVPPRGLWGKKAAPKATTAQVWLGQPLATETAADDAVLRYLAAFGPASVADIRIWSWLTGLRAVVDRLRPRLRTFRDEAGRELFDVEDGLLVDPDVPAPIRLLPQYDNIFLSHDDRSRILFEKMTVPDLDLEGRRPGRWLHLRRVADPPGEAAGDDDDRARHPGDAPPSASSSRRRRRARSRSWPRTPRRATSRSSRRAGSRARG